MCKFITFGWACGTLDFFMLFTWRQSGPQRAVIGAARATRIAHYRSCGSRRPTACWSRAWSLFFFFFGYPIKQYLPIELANGASLLHIFWILANQFCGNRQTEFRSAHSAHKTSREKKKTLDNTHMVGINKISLRNESCCTLSYIEMFEAHAQALCREKILMQAHIPPTILRHTSYTRLYTTPSQNRSYTV